MQATLVMQLEAVPIVKASLALKRKALAFSLRQYQARLTAFEQQHQLTSEQFARAFEAGELGDAEVWFEWEFVLKAVQETRRQLQLLESVAL
jgi:hypothetical protein